MEFTRVLPRSVYSRLRDGRLCFITLLCQHHRSLPPHRGTSHIFSLSPQALFTHSIVVFVCFVLFISHFYFLGDVFFEPMQLDICEHNLRPTTRAKLSSSDRNLPPSPPPFSPSPPLLLHSPLFLPHFLYYFFPTPTGGI